MASNRLNILIVGAGMYVLGKGTNGYGTVIPAIAEWIRLGNKVNQIDIASTSKMSSSDVLKRLSILNQLTGIELSVNCFPDPNKAEDISLYTQALQTIPKPACAIVVVPDHLHFRVARDCLQAGLHTLVVKPLTPSLNEAQELIKLCHSKNIYGAIEFHKRFDRANLKMKETIHSGRIGKPQYFIIEYSQRKSIPSQIFSKWVNNTNIFQYLGVHYIDIIHFVTGAVPVRVSAHGQYGWLREKGIDTYDAVHGIVDWILEDEHTFNSYTHTNWIDPETTTAMSDQKIKVIGTKGRFESDQKKRGIEVVSDDKGPEHINPDFCNTYPVDGGHQKYRGYGIESIHTFLNDVVSIEQGSVTLESLEQNRPTFKSGIPSTAVVEAVNQSLQQNGSWIDIDHQKWSL